MCFQGCPYEYGSGPNVGESHTHNCFLREDSYCYKEKQEIEKFEQQMKEHQHDEETPSDNNG